MRAVRIERPGEVNLVEMPRPLPGPGEALLRIRYVGICGADSLTYAGGNAFVSYPRIPGHEFSAEIVEIPSNASGLEPGMLVTANPYFNCGKCYSCRRGKLNCCEQNQTMGVQRDGAMMEYITMPIGRIHNGRGLSAKTLGLIEPFSISYHGVERGDVKPSDNVLVVGAGPIGVLAVAAAKLRGARVWAADVLDRRLDVALSMGADGVINTRSQDLARRVAKLTDGQGMDVCIEAVGLPETFLACIDSVCFGGRVVLIGNGKRETTFDHTILVKKELDVRGSRNSLNAFEPLIRLVAEGMVDVDRLITDVYPMSDVQSAFERLRQNDGTAMKVLVSFE